MKKSLVKIGLMTLLIITASSVQAASFDCTKARSFAEKEICSNPSLSKSDDDLSELYKKAKDKDNDSKDFRSLTRSLWNMREKCHTDECIFNWYSQANGIYSSMLNGVTTAEAHSNTKKYSNEDEFISIIKKSQEESKVAKNDMVRGGIKSRRDRGICNIIQDNHVDNWIGKISRLDANSDGKGILYVTVSDGVTMKTWNNSFSDTDDNTLINTDSELFNSASSLNDGDEVLFSGTFIADKDDGECAKEASLGLNGGLDEPEFIFKFEKIEKRTIKEPSENKDKITLAKQVYSTLLDAFTNSCVLIGKGDNDGALRAINEVTFPDGRKNPTPMNKTEFDGLREYFLQYRNLDIQHCAYYTRQFMASSAQQ